jgi:quercetin dioxygenase-like cupin family protein
VVRAGEVVIVPRGTPHTYWNSHAGPTRHLLVMTVREHGSEYLGWP